MLLSTIGALVVLSHYVEAGYNCPKDLNSTDGMRAIFLDFHNDLRRNIAYGKQENKIGYLGPAKNMYELSWDCDMERKAQQSISQCRSEKVSGNYGQNNVAMSGGILSDEIFVTLAMTNWVNPVKFFGMNSPINRYEGTLCQFANMAYSKVTKLGCAYKNCAGNFIVTCLYDKPGTLPYTIMWEKGDACKNDNDCTTYAGSSCSNGLCNVVGSSGTDNGSEGSDSGSTNNNNVSGNGQGSGNSSSGNDNSSDQGSNNGSSNNNNGSNQGSDSGSTNNNNGGNQGNDNGSDNDKPTVPPSTASCTENGMSDAARQKFLDVHNHFRSLVARGQAKDKLGGNAPKAARMKKMIYDCKVEETAMKHAKKCNFAHSSKDQRPGLGENLFMTSAQRMDKTNAAEQASKSWFSELEKYGVGQKNYFDMALFSRPKMQIGHYTQMVWQDSYKLGCYVEWCSGMTLVVCQYGPAGNMLNSYIYEVGEPCTKCTSDTKCSKDEGLCIVQ